MRVPQDLLQWMFFHAILRYIDLIQLAMPADGREETDVQELVIHVELSCDIFSVQSHDKFYLGRLCQTAFTCELKFYHIHK